MTGCVEHSGYLMPNGYGRRKYRGRMVYAHRLAFYEANGYWPTVVRHSCDNRACVNPAHLLPGTQLDNVRDMWERGRQYSPRTVSLNLGMPANHTPEYQREKRARVEAGTWVRRAIV